MEIMKEFYPILKWTYGAEHELGDWDTRKSLPIEHISNKKDHTVMNSNGIANDPLKISYPFGGEINTPAYTTIGGLVDSLALIKKSHPNVVVNHRSNLHVHIRVPGLIKDLCGLKKLAQYNAQYLGSVLELIEPIPEPSIWGFEKEAFEGALNRFKRNVRSHHTLLSKVIVEKQLRSSTIDEFFSSEVPKDSRGRPLWHLRRRAAVNVRQLLETDTIEFRHFPGTLCEEELKVSVEWCRDYLNAALNTGENAIALFHRKYERANFPKFPPFIYWRDVRFKMTCFDGSKSRDEIDKNIKNILEEDLGVHVLVLCHGNKYRSPLCAAIVESMGFSVESAGFLGEGMKAAKPVRDFATSIGLNLEGHRSRILTDAMVRRADVILFMDERNRRELGVKFPTAIGKAKCLAEFVGERNIPDPAFLQQGSKEFKSVMELIIQATKAACEYRFVTKIMKSRGFTL